ncbi:damage-control phosphatase [Thermococcus sp. 2319x1]|uniref:damage-control phosphatase n=1 Tax=Thermococcus sp. 2319x1 TaxID=1674923 RepID=UPI001583A179|nr:damage-control phosphatase [Thermococcus sp. 2319x1]
MKIHYECFTCIANQCQRIIEMSTEDLAKRKKAAVFCAKLMGKLEEESIPAIVASKIFFDLYEFLGVCDPFKAYKESSNRLAERVLNEIEAIMEVDLKTALKLAIVGNVIDFAVGYSPEKIEEDIMRLIKEDLYIDLSEELFKKLENAKVLLYLTDNCGEIYFDKLFLKKIQENFPHLDIYIAGKEAPIINDATVEDLKAAKFDEVGTIISTGSGIVGIPFGEVSGEFMEIFRRADVIIAKGQGNFETLSEIGDRRVFYLLKAKCRPVARELGVPRGSMLCI